MGRSFVQSLHCSLCTTSIQAINEILSIFQSGKKGLGEESRIPKDKGGGRERIILFNSNRGGDQRQPHSSLFQNVGVDLLNYPYCHKSLYYPLQSLDNPL